MRSIMMATDFSERSERGLQRATMLARRSGARIDLVHVVDDDQPKSIVEAERDVAERLLVELTSSISNADGIPCDARVVLDVPFAGIAQATRAAAPDLLVIGSHRRQALRDVFIGTTAERTIRSVACPVPMVNASPDHAYRHTMLATDFSEGSRRAARAFSALGIGNGAEVSVLHAFDAPALHLAMGHTMQRDERENYRQERRSKATRDLSAFAISVDGGAMRQLVCECDGTPADEILRTAEARGADLIVVGTHGRSGLARFFLGSVAEEVLRYADRDVLAVPPSEMR